MKRNIIALLAVFGLVLFCTAAPAYAGDPYDVEPWWGEGSDPVQLTDGIVGTGTIVAAAFETAGYRAQSMVLDDLGEMIGDMALLIYITCIILGIATMVLTGNMGAGIWLLIGPALFNMMVRNTTLAPGVEWRFGAFSGGSAEIADALDGTNIDYTDYEVSWLFHEFNVFTSGVIQNLIRVVSDDNVRDQSLFMVRQRILSELMQAQVHNPGLTELARYSVTHCAEELNAARIIALGKRDPDYRNTNEYRRAATLYFNATFDEVSDAFDYLYEAERRPNMREVGGTPVGAYIDALAVIDNVSTRIDGNKRQITHHGALMYLRQLYADVVGGGDNKPIIPFRNPPASQPVLTYVRSCMDPDSVPQLGGDDTLVKQTRMSCEQLWCWLGAGVQVEVVKTMKEAAERIATSKQHMNDADHDNFLLELYNDLAMKLTSPRKLLVDSFNIPTIGRTHETDEKRQIYVGGEVEPDPSVIPVVVAGYMLRKVFQGDVVHSMREQLNQHTESTVHGHNFDLSRQKDEKYPENKLGKFTDEMLEHQYSAMQQGYGLTLALLLPYLQGIFLYALGITYPFFCLMVLIPGRAGSFLGWMAFWVWAKSWDLGWAFVMIADSVLWEMLPHNGAYDPIRDPINGPITMFEVAFEGDTAYSLSNYYTLVGMMIGGVPLVTGRFILGSKQVIAGMFVTPFKNFAMKFGQQSADFISNEQLNQIELMNYSHHYRHATENMQNVADYSFSDYKGIAPENKMQAQLKSMQAQVQGMRDKGAALDKLGTDVGTQGAAALLAMGRLGYMNPAGMAVAGVMFKNRVAAQLGGAKGYNRMANALEAAFLNHNYKYQLYNYTRGDASSDMARLMDSTSFRGEWWNHWSHPDSGPAGVRTDKIKAEALEQQARYNTLTRFITGGSE